MYRMFLLWMKAVVLYQQFLLIYIFNYKIVYKKKYVLFIRYLQLVFESFTILF